MWQKKVFVLRIEPPVKVGRAGGKLNVKIIPPQEKAKLHFSQN